MPCCWSRDFRGPAQAGAPPKYDHIIVIFEENKDYDDVIGSANAPYINNTLLGSYSGVLFTNMTAETHPSQPNYLDFFSGSDQGVTDNGQYDLPGSNPPGPFTTPNLGASLLTNGYTFKGYAESMPSTGFTGASYTYDSSQNQYVLKHCPWVNWQQYGTGYQANAIPANLNVPFVTATDNPGNLPSSSYFPTDYSQLPTLSFVIPNEQNEMHDGTVNQADQWLQTYMDGYIQWARTNNSLLILTWDEDSNDGQPHDQLIPTIMVGANVKPGQYDEAVNHYSLLRTLEDMYGLPYCTANDANASPITDVFGLPGDANGDGRVDVNDLTIVLTNYGQTGMVWSQGEFTGNGTVDINDLTIVLANFGKTLDGSAAGGLAAVPEPSCVVLLAIAAGGLVAFARRRRAGCRDA